MIYLPRWVRLTIYELAVMGIGPRIWVRIVYCNLRTKPPVHSWNAKEAHGVQQSHIGEAVLPRLFWDLVLIWSSPWRWFLRWQQLLTLDGVCMVVDQKPTLHEHSKEGQHTLPFMRFRI